MPLINIPEIQTDDEATEELFNSRFDTIIDLLNGNLDADNIADGAITEEKLASTSGGGWSIPASTLTTASGYNKGNKTYEISTSTDLSTVISPGYRLKVTRGTTAPTQCADFERSTSQYASNASPTSIVFTDDWTAEAWIKLESYNASAIQTIIGRLASTSGWAFDISQTGVVDMYAFSSSGSNIRRGSSLTAVPLGEWVHVAATLDLSGNATTIYINGALVGSTTSTTGTITSVTQAGDLAIGRAGGLNQEYFDGEIAEVRVWNTIRTATDIRDNMNQQLVGNESGLVGYWKLNGSFNDSQTNVTAVNLTPANSAAATTADNPFHDTEYGIVTKVTSSILTVYTGTDYNIPKMTLNTPYYSGQKIPYGFPAEPSRWTLTSKAVTNRTTSSPSITSLTDTFKIPIGAWKVMFDATVNVSSSTTSSFVGAATLSSDGSTETNPYLTLHTYVRSPSAAANNGGGRQHAEESITTASEITFTLMGGVNSASATLSVNPTAEPTGFTQPILVRAVSAYL